MNIEDIQQYRYDMPIVRKQEFILIYVVYHCSRAKRAPAFARIPLLGSLHLDHSARIPPLESIRSDPSARIWYTSTRILPLESYCWDPFTRILLLGYLRSDPLARILPLRSILSDPSTQIMAARIPSLRSLRSYLSAWIP